MSDLIACKSCEHQVSKNAKTCPNCGAKLKMALWKKIVIGWIGLMIIASIFGGDGSDNASINTASNSGQSGPEIISLNESIIYDDVSTTIRSLDIRKRFSDSMGLFEIEAQPSASLIAVLVDQTNNSDRPISTFRLPSLTLISPTNIEYEQDIGKSASYAAIMDIDQKIMSDIGPGLRSQNVFVFEVSDQLLTSPGWVLKVGNISDFYFKVN